jgi:hypothetical protein
MTNSRQQPDEAPSRFRRMLRQIAEPPSTETALVLLGILFILVLGYATLSRPNNGIAAILGAIYAGLRSLWHLSRAAHGGPRSVGFRAARRILESFGILCIGTLAALAASVVGDFLVWIPYYASGDAEAARGPHIEASCAAALVAFSLVLFRTWSWTEGENRPAPAFDPTRPNR